MSMPQSKKKKKAKPRLWAYQQRPLMSEIDHQGSVAWEIIAVMVPQTLKGHFVLPFNKIQSEKK